MVHVYHIGTVWIHVYQVLPMVRYAHAMVPMYSIAMVLEYQCGSGATRSVLCRLMTTIRFSFSLYGPYPIGIGQALLVHGLSQALPAWSAEDDGQESEFTQSVTGNCKFIILNYYYKFITCTFETIHRACSAERETKLG